MERLLRNVCFTRDDLWLSLLSAQGHYNLTKRFSNRMNLVKQSIFKGHHQYSNVKASVINCIQRFNIWIMWHLDRKYTGNLFLCFWLFIIFFWHIDKVQKVFSQVTPFALHFQQHLEYWFFQLCQMKGYLQNVINRNHNWRQIHIRTHDFVYNFKVFMNQWNQMPF